MIVLENSATTHIALSLAESTTIENPYYIFEFKDSLGNQKIFTAPDISAYTGRTSIFVVTLTGSTQEDLIDGKIHLNFNDNWNYFIYQTTLENQTSLSAITAPNTINNFIERGKVWINEIEVLPEITVLSENTGTTRVILRNNR